MAQDARQDFAKRCGVCHGADGRGTERGPSLAKSRQVRLRSVDELRAVIRTGIPGAGMPPFDLPPAELNLLTSFVRSLNASAADANAPGDRAAGVALSLLLAKENFSGGFAIAWRLGRGSAVGPDLSETGREMTLDELEEAVHQPFRQNRQTFTRPFAYATLHGRRHVADGFARNRSRYNLQLQDLTGQFHSLRQDQIAEPDRRTAIADAGNAVQRQ